MNCIHYTVTSNNVETNHFQHSLVHSEKLPFFFSPDTVSIVQDKQNQKGDEKIITKGGSEWEM
jgi:hypothetical protein